MHRQDQLPWTETPESCPRSGPGVMITTESQALAWTGKRMVSYLKCVCQASIFLVFIITFYFPLW